MLRSVIAVIVCGVMTSAHAAQPREPAQEAKGLVQLQSGTIELARLVDLTSQRLGLRITYDEQLLKPKVTLRLPTALSDRELWDLTNRLLAEQGLVTARLAGENDPAFAVLKIGNAAQLARAERFTPGTPDEPGSTEYLASFRKISVSLVHTSAKDASAAIGSLLSKPGGAVSEESTGRTLVISDFREHAEAAAAAAIALDMPSQETRIGEYVCRHIAPAQLAAIATQVMARRDAPQAGGGGVGAAATPKPGAPASTGENFRGELIAAPGGRSVLIVAPAEREPEWMQLLERLDQREELHASRYTAGSIGATETARLLEQSISAVRAAQPTTAMADDRWSVLADETTGTVLVTGTSAQHTLVAQTLSGLASAPPESQRPLKTFTLKHRSVREVIGIIDRLIDVGVLDAAAAAEESQEPPATTEAMTRVPPPPVLSPKPSTASVALEPKESPFLNGLAQGSRDGSSRSGGASRVQSSTLTLTADEATNTLIAVGEPRALAQLEKLLPTLDVRQPQVMIEAMLVSLTDAQSLALGVELEKIELSGGTLIRLASLFGLSSAGTGSNAGSRVVGDAAGFSGVVLNPGDFSVIIRALETVNHGRSLSVPRVLVNNNQQATFNSALQQPYASTNASDTVATTSFGGTFDAGTTISVRPQIAEGDHLVLDYQVKLSSFTGSPAGDLPPPRQENSVTSVATIPDGYTVVVGGLEAITDGEGESRVPGIGAIPIIGELFKNRTNNRSRARFFVFLRANVMRGTAGTGFEELKYLSDGFSREAGLTPDQSAGGWPELAPRVIR